MRQPLDIPNAQPHHHWNDTLSGNTQRQRLIINALLSLCPRSPRGPMSAKKVTLVSKTIIFNPPILLRQNRQVKKGDIVGTPPPDDAWRTFPDDTWHIFLSGFPQEDTWRASPIRTSLGRSTRHSQTSHPDDRHITSGRPTYPIRICLSESLTKVSKSYYVISIACHDPRSATCRVKRQEWWQVTSYDLW